MAFGFFAADRVAQAINVKSATEARAGVTRHNVRYVLVFGTVGVAVLMIYFFGLHN